MIEELASKALHEVAGLRRQADELRRENADLSDLIRQADELGVFRLRGLLWWRVVGGGLVSVDEDEAALIHEVCGWPVGEYDV